ncbi:MAG TPA: farnesyl-diphosphate synthase [Eubacteriaceae bacterium]|jgi:geranylgeranyl diphosphate synthase type II|nr:farnesyl-diphosphate synthase [Eubacteriaceae bacterium]
MNFKNEYAKRQSEIESALKSCISELKGHIPEELYMSMKYSLMAGGKRLRPVMLLEFSKFGQSDYKGALPLACAMEMIHTYSLIHDDLPSMDNDDLRRGKPTNHKVYGENIAILAGDGLLNYSFETMLEGIEDGHDGYLQGMRQISKAAGARGMIGGQVDDIKNEGISMNIQTLDSINSRKTGALIKASVLAGAFFSKLDDERVENLEAYSEKVGLAFQIVDDLLDVTGDEKKTGKRAGKDQENKKTTYPVVYGIEKSRSIVDELYQQALDHLRKAQADTEFIVSLTKFLCDRDY